MRLNKKEKEFLQNLLTQYQGCDIPDGNAEIEEQICEDILKKLR